MPKSPHVAPPVKPDVPVTGDATFVDPNLPTEATAGVPATSALYVPTGLEEVTHDLVLPRLRIVQPTSKEGTKGKLWLNLTGEEFDKINCVFLAVNKGRVLFDEDLSKPPKCGSSNGAIPSPYFENPMDTICSKCIFAQWAGKDESGKGVPPKCKESRTLVGYITDMEIPFLYQVKVKAMRPTMAFTSGIFLKAKMHQAWLCDFSVILSTKEVTNAKGRFWIPTFSEIKFLKDKPYRSVYQLFGKYEAGFEPEESPEEDEAGGALPF